jgi:hypothetical protein
MILETKAIGRNTSDDKSGIIFGLVFSLIGFILLLIAFIIAMKSYSLLQDGVKAQAVVIALDERRDTDYHTDMYAPIYMFKTKSGEVVEIKSDGYSDNPSDKIGDIIDVLYIEGKESSARINQFSDLWGSPSIIASIGSFFLLFGGLFVRVSRREIKKKEYLENHGKVIEAEVIAIEYTKQNNKPSYWAIRGKWYDNFTNKTYEYYSGFLYIDPKPYVKDKINIIIYPKNPSIYKMDLSFLPK